MSTSDYAFDVAEPADGRPIPARVFDDEISVDARHVLMCVLGRPTSVKTPKLAWIMTICGLSKTRWQRARRELIQKGWLIDRRLACGGRGRGYIYQRMFYRDPLQPL